MILKDIIKIMEDLAPKNLIDSWDNCGLEIGDTTKEVKKILLSLDISQESVDYAIENGVDTIISHHPFLFSPIKSIDYKDKKSKILINLIKSDIAIYSAHSNLDICQGGINDVLAKLLKLQNTTVLEKAYDIYPLENKGEILGYGRVGNLVNPLSLLEFGQLVKKNLECDSIRLYGDIDKPVNRVALCGGSGGDFIKSAAAKGAHVYVTGDIKYHDAQMAKDLGLAIIDANHYDTEKIILPYLEKYILEKTGNEVEILTYTKNEMAFKVL